MDEFIKNVEICVAEFERLLRMTPDSGASFDISEQSKKWLPQLKEQLESMKQK